MSRSPRRLKRGEIERREAEALVESVLAKYPKRIEPRDEQYESTSPWQVLEYGDELLAKRDLVLEIFRKNNVDLLAALAKPVTGTALATADFTVATDNQEYFYRNKMEYALYWCNDENKIRLAVHKRRSYRKLPITSSSIERPEILAKALEIIDDLNARGEEARKYQSLMLRCDQSGKVSGGLLENGKPHPVFEPLSDEILGQRYSYSPNGFFQINLPMYEVALLEMKRWILGDSVLDLYAGVGTIGLSIARDKKLTLVELNASAVAEMQANIASAAVIPEPAAVLAKSEDALSHIADKDTVIVDPPRAGLHRDVVDELLKQKTKRVIYLSCNPTTQARDVKMLVDGGYRIEFAKAFNFFPRTLHIENLVVLGHK
ncbi:RsmD family RNA methyltransferase [Candidatus Saccharibacteria bacterium]|nr:RsmD family RNA methyltransferase [Candidatus Saccharibacteria bacterium]